METKYRNNFFKSAHPKTVMYPENGDDVLAFESFLYFKERERSFLLIYDQDLDERLIQLADILYTQVPRFEEFNVIYETKGKAFLFNTSSSYSEETWDTLNVAVTEYDTWEVYIDVQPHLNASLDSVIRNALALGLIE